MLPNEDEDLLFPTTPGIEFLTENVGHDRVAPEQLNLFYSATTLFGLRSATGHVFTAPTWKQALSKADSQAFAYSPTGSQLRAEPHVVTSPILDRLGVRWFAAHAWHQPIGRVEEGALATASCERPALIGQATTAVPAANGLRGVRIRLCSTVDLPHGAELAATAQAQDEAVSSRVPLPGTLGPTDLSVGLAAEDLTDGGPLTLTFDLVGGEGRALAVAADPAGAVAVEPIRPDDDGLRMAYAGDLRIYERTQALPRIRWAGDAVVVEDPADRLELLNGGDLSDDTTVLSAPGPRGSGAGATVDVGVDAPTAIVVDVDAEGSGYLVVADALQVDWEVTVDGRSADLVEAEHAGVAVAVPEGSHTVELRYRPRGQRAGVAISGVTALGLVLALVVPRVVRSRRRGASSTTGDATPSSV